MSVRLGLSVPLLLGFFLLQVLLPIPAWGDDLFENKVRPILGQCYACHSGKASIVQGGLRVDYREGLLKGGHSGPAIVPGDPDASLVVRALRYEATPSMPPWGKLEDSQIGAIVEWIRQGAPWPDEPLPEDLRGKRTTEDRGEAKAHWAWQAVQQIDPPGSSSEWPQHPVDLFIYQKLQEQGIEPNLGADPASLLRRVFLDLTGLPPSSETVQSFLKDPSSKKYEDIVDGLLASKEFGERWGRHWLDLTYYADTIGMGRLIPAPDAWRYRDYVIQSFNQDKPIDEFITEQLAGDLLPAESDEQRSRMVTATGYLALGPWALVQADKQQLEMDVVDQQIDAIGKGLLGITLACARCHDHKFDPIKQKEYYGVAGILASTRTISGKIREAGVFSDVNRVLLPETPAEAAAREAEAREYDRAIAEIGRRMELLQKEMGEEPAKADTGGEEPGDSVKRLLSELEKRRALLQFNKPRPPSANAVEDRDEVTDCRITIRGNAHNLGEPAPRGFVQIAMFEDQPTNLAGSGRLELAHWIADKRNPLTARVYVNRIWQHLFGAGIVKSVDNFGLRGDKPSHPELLDYLATEFIESGWSTKSLIRMLVLSKTYQLSTDTGNEAGVGKDPENRLLWRANRWRIEPEILRDSILAIGRGLDITRGGPTLPTADLSTFDPGPSDINPEFMKAGGPLPEKDRRRRTVYLPVYRQSQMEDLDMLNLFDFAGNSQIDGARSRSVLPTQALFLMNSPWLWERAAELAKISEERYAALDVQRVEWLMERVYGRQATPEGVSWALDFIYSYRQKAPDNKEEVFGPDGWTSFAHALLGSNEFLFRR